MRRILSLVWLVLAVFFLKPGRAAQELHHFVFLNRDRERISEEWFLTNRVFEGVQIKYTWRELEPQKGQYDFGPIRTDRRVLAAQGKKLFVQLQDSSFDERILNVPEYLLRDPEFHGGANRQFSIENDNEAEAKPAGWVARRWDTAVQGRFHSLLNALGKEFDGQVEGINLPETSVDFGESGRLYPPGFTPEIYSASVITNMAALKRAFPKSVAMQYANFMPGEWLPENDHSFLKTVFAKAKELRVATGGPDLLPDKPGQMNHSYPMLRGCAGVVPTGIAVQWGNYEHRHPKTGRTLSVGELIEFARDYLKVSYIFWSTQEPYFSNKVIPFLQETTQ